MSAKFSMHVLPVCIDQQVCSDFTAAHYCVSIIGRVVVYGHYETFHRLVASPRSDTITFEG